MKTEKIAALISQFDPELDQFLQSEFSRQKNYLSLTPEENYTSPLSAYLEGSILTNVKQQLRDGSNDLEQLTIRRVKAAFGSEHANIRCGNIATASRAVMYALLKPGDKILSLDMRKQEHCNNESLNFEFINFGIDPETERINFSELERLVRRHKPEMIVYSAANYPRLTQCQQFAEIAKIVGAYMWFDISHKAGLIASGAIPSPVSYGDIVTFSTHESLQGPKGAVILCRKALAEKMDAAVRRNGHFSLKANELAAMAVMFKECRMEKFKMYCQQVLKNAQSLASGLQDGQAQLVCGGTDNHLVIVNTQSIGLSGQKACEVLESVGISVKPCVLRSMDPAVTYDGIRLSSLVLTTRGLKENDLYIIGGMIIHALKNADSPEVLQQIRVHAANIIAQYPLYSEQWIEVPDFSFPSLYEPYNVTMQHVTAESKQYYLKNLRDSIMKFIRGK